HCVGFSTVRFTLDQEPMDDLVGHQGQEISAEVLATFLPHQVVDALMAVLRQAGLAARSLTLEPIAALEATIPPDLRRMNIALVDVGAGTSDIAITRHGSVFAYAMVTQAGDEITERLSEHYLLEFNEAERVKRLLATTGQQPVEMSTILSQKLSIPAADILHTLRPAVKKLAKAIADTILQLNGSVPRAVIMVGGGSATPELGPQLAEILKIEPQRVGCRGPETIKDIDNATSMLHGIEGVTPLGIALLALRGKGMKFIPARVNQVQVQLLALHEKPTVFDALLAAGRESKALYPRPGKALTYTLGGTLMTVPGTLGDMARITVDGEAATLDTVLGPGAAIEVCEARDGEDAVLTPGAVPKPAGPCWCTLNGAAQELELMLAAQGESVESAEVLPDRAELEWVNKKTLGEMVSELEKKPLRWTPLRVQINGVSKHIPRESGMLIQVNGKSVEATYRPRPNDRIEWRMVEPGLVRVRDLGLSPVTRSSISVIVNGKPRTLDTGGTRILVNGQPASEEAVVPDQAEVSVEVTPQHPPILSQVLEGLDLAPLPQSGPIQLMVDGQKAAFTTPLKNGSRVEISFG
ncbi:rod shape-determining protein, partial [candidate division FCPU426 bacterium]|nr:rod shape-determining protein [candidate division FCPU426 bacterium]